MKIGVLGLGRMGSRIAQKLHDENHQVFVWNRSWETTEKFIKSLRGPVRNFPSASAHSRLTGLRAVGNLSIPATPFKAIQDLVSKLPKPRILWIMLPAGEPTQNAIDELPKYLQKGDIVIDGGNAHFKDTEKRYQKFKKLGIEFLGIGVSGGIVAARNGYPLMVGGSKKAYLKIKPILNSLAKPNGGYEYFGEGGAGHFIKMVHNGIEYGIMQSLGEGFAVLEKSKYNFNLVDVAKIWQKGTLVSGFMLDRAVDALAQDSKLASMAGPVSESGEARWTIEEARREKVQVKIIQNALDYRLRSQKDKKLQKSFTARMLNGLRSAFGGHEVKK